MRRYFRVDSSVVEAFLLALVALPRFIVHKMGGIDLVAHSQGKKWILSLSARSESALVAVRGLAFGVDASAFSFAALSSRLSRVGQLYGSGVPIRAGSPVHFWKDK